MRQWFCIAVIVAAGGCSEDGPKRARLTGAVKYDGQPIPYGEVLFTPDATKKNSGPQGLAPIRDGRYDTGGGKGVGSGPMIARVTGFTAEGGKLLCEVEISIDLPPDGGTKDIDVPKQPPAAGPAKPAIPDRKEI